MCGIIGYIGYRPAPELLLEGLKRLEYRGYDSAGVAWREDGAISLVRAVGNLDALRCALDARAQTMVSAARAPGRDVSVTATAAADIEAGIGHTRWATHGGVTECNAHPHADMSGRFLVVVNGIIENYASLRDRLVARGVRFSSETDAEVVAQLIATHYDGDLAQAVARTLEDVSGHYALVAMAADEPTTLVCVRRECPLVIGTGEGEQFVASSIAAFLAYSRDVVFLRDGEIAVLRPDGVSLVDAAGGVRVPVTSRIGWDEDRMEKEGYETFMLKEIHEQGTAIGQTLSQWRADAASGAVPLLAAQRLRGISRVLIIACGTSYHAGLAGQVAIERWARLPVEVSVASEFRYRDPIVDPDALVLGITQSGETADTLAAMRLARERGAHVVAITNVAGSQATRDSDAVLFTRAGIEMGVAATKTFVAQVVLLYALALRLAELRETMPGARVAELQHALSQLPGQMDELVLRVEPDVRLVAQQWASRPFFLFLGRLAGLPVALEGALKLKEISYVPTDAYAAGEMKHGPIALLSQETPVVCVAIEPSIMPKLLSNLCEVRARGAQVMAVASEGSKEIAEHAEHVFYIPATDPVLQVPLAVVPLQLFAYHLARTRGLNVDQPRNLAKTVTVE